MSARELTDAEVWFTRESIERWLRDHPSEHAASLAKRVGITKAQIGDVKRGDRAPGLKTAMGLAAVLGLTWEEFKRAAADEYAKRPAADSAPPPDIHIEYDDRYPNRRRALAGLDVAGVKLHPRARRAIETRVYHSTTDPPPEHWIREAMQLDERARWEDANPEQAALERDRDRARLEQLLAEENAKSQAAVDKIPGVRGPKDLDPPPPKAVKKPGGR